MILTCPNCATRFFADSLAIGCDGRRVKCAACGGVWTAASEPQFAANAESEITVASSEHPLDGEGADVDAQSTSVESAPLFVNQTSRTRGAARKSRPRPGALGVVIALFVVVAGLLVFQRSIERSFPGAATFYDSVGLKSARASVG